VCCGALNLEPLDSELTCVSITFHQYLQNIAHHKNATALCYGQGTLTKSEGQLLYRKVKSGLFRKQAGTEKVAEDAEEVLKLIQTEELCMAKKRSSPSKRGSY